MGGDSIDVEKVCQRVETVMVVGDLAASWVSSFTLIESMCMFPINNKVKGGESEGGGMVSGVVGLYFIFFIYI